MNLGDAFTIVLLLGLFFGFIANPLLKNAIKGWQNFKRILDDNKKFAEKKAEVEKMKTNGDFHEWITIPTLSGEMMVCKKTGWYPTAQGFVPMELINEYLRKVKLEEEYREYRNAKVAELAKELDFSLEKMETVVEKIFSMKKSFYLGRIEKLSEEFKQRADDVRTKQDNQ